MQSTSSKTNLERRLTFLKSVPLFATLKEADLTAIQADLSAKTFRRGEIIFHQGDESRELYIINSGKVRIYHISPAGEETTVNILAYRQLIGEFAIIDSQPRSATAQAVSACTLLVIHQTQFLRYLESLPPLAVAMCYQLTQKARATSMVAETIAQLDAAGRLLQFLLHYKDSFGEELEAGKRYLVDLGLNQTDLASLIGAKRGWVNRILGEWRKRGLLEFEAGKVTILDLPSVIAERDSRLGGNSETPW